MALLMEYLFDMLYLVGVVTVVICAILIGGTFFQEIREQLAPPEER